MKDISVIISCRNEVVGTLITMRSAMEEFKNGLNGEVVICDNSDNHRYPKAIKQKYNNSEWIKNEEVKFLTQSFPCLFTAREKAINAAEGKFILIVDSHCIFGKDSIREMLRTAKQPNIGFVYGLMNFSRNHELESYCDRDIENFLGIRLYEYPNKPTTFEIPFRGMPFLCSKAFFQRIKGYGTLSELKLTWGDGDFILGLKSALLGYKNLINTNASVIHLGPFKNSQYFPKSFIRESGSQYPKRFEMLLSAYIIGGEELLTKRIKQLSQRLKYQISGNDYNLATQLGAKERKWLLENATLTYNDLVKKFKPLQTQSNDKPVGYEPLPPSDGTLVDEKQQNVTTIRTKGVRKNSWKARIIVERDRSKIKQSGAIQ